MVKEVAHLTMVLVLDEDHTHYSDAFGNIFKSGPLCKKQFPEGLGSIKTKKGGAAWAIICHFCPHACSNDDYAYRHLVAIRLNIQWGCRTCYGHVMDMLVGIYQKLGNTFSPTTRRALGSDPAHCTRRVTVGNLTHPWMAC